MLPRIQPRRAPSRPSERFPIAIPSCPNSRSLSRFPPPRETRAHKISRNLFALNSLQHLAKMTGYPPNLSQKHRGDQPEFFRALCEYPTRIFVPTEHRMRDVARNLARSRHSFALSFSSTATESRRSALFARKHRGGGYP